MLTAHPVPGKQKSCRLCEAFVRGAPVDAVGAVFYGVTAVNLAQWRRALASGEPWYYIDNTYFDATRGRRFRVTKNRLQVRAADHTSDGRRFDALGLEIAPWRQSAGGHWLAVQQSPTFSLVADHARWLSCAVGVHCSREHVVWRPWASDKPAQAATLPEALAGACGVITHTSAAAVQAVLAGVPCIVSPLHALDGMPCGAARPDLRRQYLSVLADHEFSAPEMEDGAAWRRLHA